MPDRSETIICRCEEISRGEVLMAIAAGARSLTEIKWLTRTGMGLCQGKTCGRLVAQILAGERHQSIDQVLPFSQRPPVRPLPLSVLPLIVEGES